MPHQHGHGGHEKKADFWTEVATVGEAISSALSNFYWGVSLTNLFYQSPDDDTASDISLYVGIAFSALALGSAYTHRQLNIYHQHKHKEASEKAPFYTMNFPYEVEDHETSLLTPDSQEGHDHPPLTGMQKIALGADFVTHTGDVSGAISAGSDLIAKTAFNTVLPAWSKIAVQSTATVCGMFSAYANVRTCQHAMTAKDDHHPEGRRHHSVNR